MIAFKFLSLKKSSINKNLITKQKRTRWSLNPFKHKLKRCVGRNNLGQITSRHRKVGHKRIYRALLWCPHIYYNFNKNRIGAVTTKANIAICISINYDPGRNANIACISLVIKTSSYWAFVRNRKSLFFWMLAPYNLEVGSLIAYGANLDLKAIPRIGRNHFFIRTQLKNLKQGRLIHGVTLRQGAAAKPIIAIAAGTSCKIIQYHRLENKVVLCLPSKQHILVSGNCYATTGQVSKPNHYLKKLKKAGQRRWLGWRSKVRGVAINPVDHAHGGRTNGGRPSVSPWGKYTKGFKTKRKLLHLSKN